MHNESTPYENLSVEFGDVTIETASITSKDGKIVEETIVLSPRKIVFNMVPSKDYRSPGVTGELTCDR